MTQYWPDNWPIIYNKPELRGCFVSAGIIWVKPKIGVIL